MIPFKTQIVHALSGGLNVQIIMKKSNGTPAKSCSELSASDFAHSLLIDETTFFLIEPFFSSCKAYTDYYHYGFHYHDDNDLKGILSSLHHEQRIWQAQDMNTADKCRVQEILDCIDLAYLIHQDEFGKQYTVFLDRLIRFFNAENRGQGCYIMGI
ncbi:hypothetical protein [Conchiformibius steedae]|uniref:hypothetical protein n=1 Tax=Conchiformibius steedae TaxID=153493 RepID=UPI0026EDE1C8|nr:hypothetical protein [Conchiformibius steedae]